MDIERQECKKITLDKEDFRPIGIPSNASLVGLATVGGPGGIAVETWAGEFAAKNETGEGQIINYYSPLCTNAVSMIKYCGVLLKLFRPYKLN